MRIRHAPILIAAAAILYASCAGAPPPAPVEKPAAAPAVPAPDAEMAKAKERRDYIKQHGLDAYAPEPYKQAEERFAAAQKALGQDNAAAKKELEAALPLYDRTVEEGFGWKVEEKLQAARGEREKADAEKAAAGAKQPYGAGEAAFSKASKDADAKRYPEAVASFEEAAKQFAAAAKLAAERRAKARAALDSADTTIKSTEERMKAIDEELKADEGAAE